MSSGGRKGHLEDEEIMQEGFGQIKSRMRISEINLIFRLLPKLNLTPVHISRVPFPPLTPTPDFSLPESPRTQKGDTLLSSEQLQIRISIHYFLPSE